MRKRTHTLARLVVVALVATAGQTSSTQGQPSPALVQSPPIPHESGQSVAPSFEGWYRNADGSFTLSFGYFNRNYVEEPDIPVGASNHFSPGPEDRGQPTHFMPRRVFGAFGVVVPKESATDKNFRLTWSLTAHGETVAIPGHLRPEWEIDALQESTSGNRPPTLTFEPRGRTGAGPLGVTASMTVAGPGRPAEIVVYATDDGVRKAGGARATGLGVAWTKFRGPGTVTFDPSAPAVQNGKAVTRATFSAPGEYRLRLHAWDDSGRYAGGFQCCWSNAFMNVTVADHGRTP